jgi:hypothetical protein
MPAKKQVNRLCLLEAGYLLKKQVKELPLTKPVEKGILRRTINVNINEAHYHR